MKLDGEVAKKYGLITLVIGIVLIILSLVSTLRGEPATTSPAIWLNEWTAWAAKYVALVIAAGSVVGLTKSVMTRLLYVVNKDGSVTDLTK
jgi:heme A synthase